MLSMRYFLLNIFIFWFATPLTIAEWISCNTQSTFSSELENNTKVFIYDAEINVQYERMNLAVYAYNDADKINILINNTLVSLKGQILQENEELDPNLYKLYFLHTKIAGNAKLENSYLTNCELYLSRNPYEDLHGLPKRMQIQVLHQAAACIRASICEKLGKVRDGDFRHAEKNPYNFGPLKVQSKNSQKSQSSSSASNASSSIQSITPRNVSAIMTSVQQNSSNVELQSAINMIVDLVISEIVSKIRKESNGIIKIPDISEKFSLKTIWKPFGEFDAIDGVFSDLTTLSRINDAHLSHNGLKKFTVSCGFGLSKANIHYNKYKLKYGLKVSGELSANVDGVALDTAVVIDYTQKPCRISLLDLGILDLGRMDVEITGLGPLNKLTSILISWITKMWKEEVITMVQGKVKGVVEDYLSKLDCEKYRP